MPVMAVNNEHQREQTGDYRSRPRWSAGKKMENEILRAAAEERGLQIPPAKRPS
jgi:hypothetical protein